MTVGGFWPPIPIRTDEGGIWYKTHPYGWVFTDGVFEVPNTYTIRYGWRMGGLPGPIRVRHPSTDRTSVLLVFSSRFIDLTINFFSWGHWVDPCKGSSLTVPRKGYCLVPSKGHYLVPSKRCWLEVGNLCHPGKSIVYGVEGPSRTFHVFATLCLDLKNYLHGEHRVFIRHSYILIYRSCL
jgi:hypothetical protein